MLWYISNHHSLVMEGDLFLTMETAPVVCVLDQRRNLFDCRSIEATGHSNLRMEFSLTHNEETWWLMSLWLNRRHISDASKDLGALLETQTLTWNFPSSAAAERTPVLLLLSVFVLLLCSDSLYFLVIISLFTTFSQLWLHLNKNILSNNHKHLSIGPLVQLEVVEPSFTVSSWFPHSVQQVFYSECDLIKCQTGAYFSFLSSYFFNWSEIRHICWTSCSTCLVSHR